MAQLFGKADFHDWKKNIPQSDDAAFRKYMDDLRTKMYNGVGVPNTLFEGMNTNYAYTSARQEGKTYQQQVDAAKARYRSGYDAIFDKPSTRPAYQGPVTVCHGKTKTAYQRKKDAEAAEKVYKEAQAKKTLRFIYERSPLGTLRLVRVVNAIKGNLV